MTHNSDPSNEPRLDTNVVPDRTDQLSSQLETDDADEVGNIDKIRDILFGGQMQDYDRRFSRLEGQVQRVESELQETLNQRIGALEHQMQEEVKALQAQLAVEQGTRTQAVTLLIQDVKDLGVSFEAKTDQLAQQTGTANHELKQALLEQSKQLSLDIQQKYTDISLLLEKELQELRHAKLDRTALADLLGDAVTRLQK